MAIRCAIGCAQQQIRPVHVAIGILSTPSNIERRSGSRRTWLAAASPDITHRFLLRSKLLSSDVNATLQAEHAAH
eukprot:5986540-Prymnesium_polylepis.1